MARTAKKQIAIYDEGLLLTVDADSIDFTGGGISSTVLGNDVGVVVPAGSVTEETPTGAVDGSNTTYTVSNTPKFVVIDGMMRVSGFGYAYLAGTITVDPLIPPVSFIRSYY